MLKLPSQRLSWYHHLLTAAACANIGFFAYIAARHLFDPPALEPSYYFLTLISLRQFALLGTIGCGWMLYRITRRETRSVWLGWITLGLFAGACQMLGTAYQRDTCVLFLLLGGCYLMGYSESRKRDMLGMLLLVAAFWMKPHTFLFIAGGLAFMTWRDCARGLQPVRIWPCVVAAFLLGPIPYAFFPRTEFVSFNWDPVGTSMFAEWLARRFVVLAALAGAGLQLSLEHKRPMSVWVFLLPIAFATAMIETMTPGFTAGGLIPFAAWLILSGVLALPKLERNVPWLRPIRFAEVALCLSFAALLA